MLSLNEPKNSDIHTICDFWELLCLLTPDQECSLDYLNDFVADYKDNGRRAFSDDELSDVLAQASWREGSFGDCYPFSVDIEGLISAENPFSDRQRFYFFLLICSNLAFVTMRTHWQPLTDAFERASHCALKRMWPSTGVAVPFGKNTTGYIGTKWERLNLLGSQIGGRPRLTEKDFRGGDGGDGGIDLAGWLDMDLHEPKNKMSILAQCACSREDWVKKQTEISSVRLANMLSPTAPWIECLFSPVSFRDNSGQWAISSSVANIVLIDRLRLLNSISLPDDLAAVGVPATVQGYLQQRLELV